LMNAVGGAGVDDTHDFDVAGAFAKLGRRYDWLSAVTGALMGTSYGVYRGQPPAQALGVTLCATVTAVAIDELIREQEEKTM